MFSLGGGDGGEGLERDLWNSDGLLVTSEKLTVDF